MVRWHLMGILCLLIGKRSLTIPCHSTPSPNWFKSADYLTGSQEKKKNRDLKMKEWSSDTQSAAEASLLPSMFLYVDYCCNSTQ